MTNKLRDKLMSMDKERLVDIIDKYHKTDMAISEVLVDVTKGTMAASLGIMVIRDYSTDLNNILE